MECGQGETWCEYVECGQQGTCCMGKVWDEEEDDKGQGRTGCDWKSLTRLPRDAQLVVIIES